MSALKLGMDQSESRGKEMSALRLGMDQSEAEISR